MTTTHLLMTLSIFHSRIEGSKFILNVGEEEKNQVCISLFWDEGMVSNAVLCNQQYT